MLNVQNAIVDYVVANEGWPRSWDELAADVPPEEREWYERWIEVNWKFDLNELHALMERADELNPLHRHYDDLNDAAPVRILAYRAFPLSAPNQASSEKRWNHLVLKNLARAIRDKEIKIEEGER